MLRIESMAVFSLFCLWARVGQDFNCLDLPLIWDTPKRLDNIWPMQWSMEKPVKPLLHTQEVMSTNLYVLLGSQTNLLYIHRPVDFGVLLICAPPAVGTIPDTFPQTQISCTG